MNYVTLTPEVFFDEDGYLSLEYLSQYCQLSTTDKFIYAGRISGILKTNLIYPNIAKIDGAQTGSILNQFPDTEEMGDISYFVPGIPDIGNLKSVGSFYLHFMYANTYELIKFIKKYIKVIDENTLAINKKRLKVDNYWQVGPISKLDYKNNWLIKYLV